MGPAQVTLDVICVWKQFTDLNKSTLYVTIVAIGEGHVLQRVLQVHNAIPKLQIFASAIEHIGML